MEHVNVGAAVSIRPRYQSSASIPGTVRTIDWNVTETPFGNVVKVIAVVPKAPANLRNGMTGYAKIEGPTLPVWQAFTLALTRFFALDPMSGLSGHLKYRAQRAAEYRLRIHQRKTR